MKTALAIRHACELLQAGIDPRKLRAEAQARQTDFPLAAQAAFTAWLDGVKTVSPGGAS